ncbi:MAG: hypothetical protein SPI03_03625, partial [Campylobacter sputorum]|nr:hypothetical protein [Campylobacter sputorum]
NAKTMAQKKAAATWQSKAYNGRSDKLASNFGLPPYHFRCRTEVVPVWIDEEDIGGIKMKNTMPVSKDEIIRHIDKTGVERVLKKDNYFEGNHSTPIYKKAPKLGIIKALNSINEVAPNARIQNYTNAFCDNGYCLVFNGDEIVTAIPPKNGKKCAYEYFKRGIIKDKKEVIKWSIGNLKSHFMA